MTSVELLRTAWQRLYDGAQPKDQQANPYRKAKLARSLAVDPSLVTRWLSGERPLTLAQGTHLAVLLKIPELYLILHLREAGIFVRSWTEATLETGGLTPAVGTYAALVGDGLVLDLEWDRDGWVGLDDEPLVAVLKSRPRQGEEGTSPASS